MKITCALLWTLFPTFCTQVLRQLKRLQMGASQEQSEAIHTQKLALQLNLAAVHQKLEEYVEAVKVCTEVSL